MILTYRMLREALDAAAQQHDGKYLDDYVRVLVGPTEVELIDIVVSDGELKIQSNFEGYAF